MIDVETVSDNVTIDGRACRLTLFQDVTERNQTAAALATAHDQAVDASNMKSAFLANMSHEIRTPMNGVIGLAELLLESDLDPEQRQLAQQLVLSGGQLVALSSDILDISKIEAGRLELDPTDFDLHETIEQPCAATGVSVRAKGVALDARIDPSVPRALHGDGGRFRQILTNLLSNAGKFTARGSVTVLATGRPGDRGTRGRRGCASRSPIPASGSTRRRSSRSSSRSRRPTARRRVITAAPVWDSRSFASWSR